MNEVPFTYTIGTETLSLTGSTQVDEPNQCGDHILSRTEECEPYSGGILVIDPDVLDGSGNLLSGLVCANTCQIEMTYVANTATMCDTTFNPPICLTGTARGSITDALPNLTITKTAQSGTFSVGQEASYVIQITNTGQARAVNVSFTDVWPSDQFAYLRSTTNRNDVTINATDTYYTTVIPSIDVGETVKIVMYGQVIDASQGNIFNRACVQIPLIQDRICNDAELQVKETAPVIGKVTVNKITTTPGPLYL